MGLRHAADTHINTCASFTGFVRPRPRPALPTPQQHIACVAARCPHQGGVGAVAAARHDALRPPSVHSHSARRVLALCLRECFAMR